MQWLRSGLVLLGVVCVWVTVGSAQQPPTAAPAAPSAAVMAAALPPENPDERLISMNFQDIDLGKLAALISDLTGLTVIVDEKVKGKATIISPGKISVDEAYAVFQSVLQMKGFTTVPSGSVLKIIPSQEAKSNAVNTIFAAKPVAEGDDFVTQVIPLDNVDVNAMLAIIQPLVSANGLLAAYSATNTMILIDSASNIDRIVKILKALDIPDKGRCIDVVRLNYSVATVVAATLAEVLEDTTSGLQVAARTGRRPGAPVEGGTAAYKIIPDERTNALIVVAWPLQMRRIKDLVVRLDVPLPYDDGRLHVYHLKYANAYEMTSILSDLIGGGQ